MHNCSPELSLVSPIFYVMVMPIVSPYSIPRPFITNQIYQTSLPQYLALKKWVKASQLFLLKLRGIQRKSFRRFYPILIRQFTASLTCCMPFMVNFL